MKTSRSHFARFAALVAFFNFVPLTRAQLIYDNIGNGGAFTATSGLVIGSSTGAEAAVRFTAGSSLFLDYVDLRLWSFAPGGTGSVALLANGGDGKPGTVLEQAPVSFPLLGPFAVPLTRVEFSNSVLLTEGTLYWLSVSPTTTANFEVWDNTSIPIGSVAMDTGSIGAADPWNTVSTSTREGAMRIFGVEEPPVPEPSTYGLLGSALLIGLSALQRRAKRA